MTTSFKIILYHFHKKWVFKLSSPILIFFAESFLTRQIKLPIPGNTINFAQMLGFYHNLSVSEGY